MKPPPDALSKDARALLRAARGGDDVSAAERQRLLEAFQRRVHADERSRLRAPPRRMAWALAALVTTGSVAALAQQGAFERLSSLIERALGVPESGPSTQPVAPPGVHRAAERQPEPPPEPSALQPEVAVPERLPSARVIDDRDAGQETTPARSAAAVPRARSAARSAASTGSAASLDHAAGDRKTRRDGVASEELDLIIAARDALVNGKHAAARAAVSRHEQRFADGAFSEEREAILALCDCRERHAPERGRAFVERRPDSLFAERIRQDCSLETNLVPAGGAAATH